MLFTLGIWLVCHTVFAFLKIWILAIYDDDGDDNDAIYMIITCKIY